MKGDFAAGAYLTGVLKLRFTLGDYCDIKTRMHFYYFMPASYTIHIYVTNHMISGPLHLDNDVLFHWVIFLK